MHFLYWNEREQKLKPTYPYWAIPISMEFPFIDYKKDWHGSELKTIVQNGAASPAKVIWENGDVLHLTSDKSSYLEINLAGLPCWPINFVSFKVKIAPLDNKNPSSSYELHFSNSITQEWSSIDYYPGNTFSVIKIAPTGGDQDLIFPLRGFPHWSLGGTCGELKLSLPPHSDIKLMAIRLPETKTIIPIVKGSSIIKFNHFSNEELVHYDASCIKNCTHVGLEIIGPYKTNGPAKDFQTLYSYQSDKDAACNIATNNSTGTLKIQRKMFSNNGCYKARFRALDKNGNQVGLCGDHFLINVD